MQKSPGDVAKKGYGRSSFIGNSGYRYIKIVQPDFVININLPMSHAPNQVYKISLIQKTSGDVA